MPILIEKSRGVRTCRMVNNVPKPANMVEDLIGALKGLTFKFEFKITDIVCDSTIQSEPKSVNLSQSKNAIQPEPKVAITPEPKYSLPPQPRIATQLEPRIAVQPEPKIAIQPEPKIAGLPEPRIDILPEPKIAIQLEPRIAIPPQLRIAPQPVPEIPVQSEPKIAIQPEPQIAVQSEPKIAAQPETKIVAQPEPNLAITPQPKPAIKQGTLTVGSLLNTTCIAVDDAEEIPSAYVAYSKTKLLLVAERLKEVSLEIESMPVLKEMSTGDVVYAKSNDDNQWYRGTIEKIEADLISIFFFDWGLREQVTQSRLRKIVHPELKPDNEPACGIRIKFSSKPGQAITEFLKCELDHRIVVESFDDKSRSYEVTVLPN